MAHNVDFIMLTHCWKVDTFGYIDLALIWESKADTPLLLFIVCTSRFSRCTQLHFWLLSLVVWGLLVVIV